MAEIPLVKHISSVGIFSFKKCILEKVLLLLGHTFVITKNKMKF
jgi:hypothetical protein